MSLQISLFTAQRRFYNDESQSSLLAYARALWADHKRINKFSATGQKLTAVQLSYF